MSNVMYAKSEIEPRIKKIIIEKLGINDCEIPNEASFMNDLGIDSLDLYEVFMEIEKEFKLKIPDEEAEKLRTTGAVINYIRKQL